MPPRKKTEPHQRGEKRGDREPRTRLDTEERRSQLRALGLEHFGKTAYDDVSIDAIAAAAGISKGLLYHYFPTKKAFYAATVREASARLLERTETPKDKAPLEQLTEGLDAYLDFVREHAAAYTTLMRSGLGVDPEIAELVDETREKFVARLTQGILMESPSPLFELALRGWVGMCEHVSLAWTEDLAARKKRPVSQAQVRDLLAKSLIAIVERALL